MAEKEIFLEVDTTQAADALGRVNKAIADLRAENASMKKELKAGTGDWAELSKKIAENDKAIKLLSGDQKTLTGQIQSQQEVLTQTTGSYDELNATLQQSIKEYKSLSAAQRESASGKALLKQIGETDAQLKKLDYSMGEFHRNVGNYPSALQPLEGILKKVGLTSQDFASKGLGALKTGMSNAGSAVKAFGKTLLTTPLGWLLAALTAIVAIFDKVRDAIKKNDDASTALARLWSSFDPILKMINKGFEKVADAIGWVANKIANLLASFSDEVKAAQEVVTATDALEDKEREYAEETARNDAKISELKAKAAEKDKYTAKERIGFMEDAIAAEKENLRMQKELADERLKMLQAEADKTADTSDEMKNKLSQARIAQTKAEQAYNDGVAGLNKKLSAFRKEEAADAKAAADAVVKAREEENARLAAEDEKAREERERREKEQAANLKAIQDELADYVVSKITDENARRLAELELRHTREMEKLRDRFASEESLTAEGREKLAQLQAEKDAEYIAQRDEFFAQLGAQDEEREMTEAERLTEEYDAKIIALQTFLEQASGLEISQREELNARIEELEQQKNAAVEKAQKDAAKKKQASLASEVAATAQAIGGLYDSLGSLAKSFAKDEKQRAKMEKGLAIGKALISSGVAIAQGTAQAMSVPFPANIAAIVTTVATIAANIATAISTIKQAEFATGGIVGGTSYTGDNVPVRVNSGEMILNREQQTRLFEIANTGGAVNYELMTAAMVSAVAAMPAPVLQYTEFETFTDDVKAVRMAAEY